MRAPSPYLEPGFYDRALAEGRHRDIVGGRWDETGRVQMQALVAEGLRPEDRLLDIGAGSLRLGCKAVPWLHPGHYWATDASLALMQRGRVAELPDPDRLPPGHLVQDDRFALPGIPSEIDMAIAFGVFTHLPDPGPALATCLGNLRDRCPRIRAVLFTVFLAPEGHGGAFRQADGVVTHPDRAPRHTAEGTVQAIATAAGFALRRSGMMLPRGQVLFVATPGLPQGD